MTLQEEDRPRRRRGEALDAALLDAAWQELLERGYAAFTFDGVAKRAGTGRAVVYRRWPAKADLLRAALAHVGERDRTTVPDTGSLREDVLEILRHANRTRAGFAALLTTHLGAYFDETQTSMSDLREVILTGRQLPMEVILQRAQERGEVDPARITPRIASVPFDLFRHELLMTLRPVPEQTLVEIVDTIFLPLVRPPQP